MKGKGLSKGLSITIIVVLTLAIIGAAGAFFFIWQGIADANAQLRARHIPVNVRIIAGDGIYNSFEAKSQIVLYNTPISISPVPEYRVVERFSGALFPLQDVLLEHVLRFERLAVKDMEAFGYSDVRIHQIYAVDFNENASLSLIAAALAVTEPDGRQTFIPYLRLGNYAVTHSFGEGMENIEEVFDKYIYVFGFSGIALSGEIATAHRPPVQIVDFNDIRAVNREAIKGDFLPPNMFTNNGDINITATFEDVVPFNMPGRHVVRVNLENESGEIRTVEADLTIYDGVRFLQQEAYIHGAGMTLERFFASGTNLNDMRFNDDEIFFNPTVPGLYYAKVEMGDNVSHLTISVVDTTPPVADAYHVTTAIGFSVSADAFVTNIRDYSAVSVSFLGGEPNAFIIGESEVTLLLTDEFGNATVMTSLLTVLDQDFLLPEFEYIPNRYFQIGQPVNFMEGVRIRTGSDPQSVIAYDASGVNLTVPGRYRVYYTAVDRNNNESTVFAYIVMTDTDLARVMDYADRILDDILRDNMTEREVARAIFDFTTSNIAYAFSTEREDPILGAFAAFTRARGDCFIFYSTSEVLLTRAGIKNTRVSRIPGTAADHYWHFVNVGDGWYHFDTTPFVDAANGFLFNDATAQSVTAMRGRNYYTFDRSLFEHLDIR